MLSSACASAAAWQSLAFKSLYISDLPYEYLFLVHKPVYLLVVYGRCLPGPIDIDSKDLMDKLNKTAQDLQEVVQGQDSVNIFIQAKEVQLHVVSVCVCIVLLF
jgi:hypothetical protein